MESNKLLSSLIFLTVIASGCTGMSSYGENTVLEYEDDIEQEKIENIHTALTETEWRGNTANITRENSTWHTLNVETDIQASQITLDQQFRIQQNAFQIKSKAFNDDEVLELKAYNTDGEHLNTFAQ